MAAGDDALAAGDDAGAAGDDFFAAGDDGFAATKEDCTTCVWARSSGVGLATRATTTTGDELNTIRANPVVTSPAELAVSTETGAEGSRVLAGASREPSFAGPMCWPADAPGCG